MDLNFWTWYVAGACGWLAYKTLLEPTVLKLLGLKTDPRADSASAELAAEFKKISPVPVWLLQAPMCMVLAFLWPIGATASALAAFSLMLPKKGT